MHRNEKRKRQAYRERNGERSSRLDTEGGKDGDESEERGGGREDRREERNRPKDMAGSRNGKP